MFRIRGDLSEKYDSSTFLDRDGSGYSLHGRRDYSVVAPEQPFSIIDRTPFLKKEGVERFLLDLSNANPAKGFFRDIGEAALEARILPDASRFNWKDGFYNDEEMAKGREIRGKD